MVGALARIRPSSVMVDAVQRHVEVRADQDPLAAQVAEVGQGRECASRQSDWPTSFTRSTSRLE